MSRPVFVFALACGILLRAVVVLSLLAALSVVFASAEGDAEALSWLERAYVRHGGVALSEVASRSSRSLGSMRLLLEGADVEFETEALMDPLAGRHVLVLRMGGEIVVREECALGSCWRWAPFVGRSELSAEEVRAMEGRRVRDFRGLALGVTGRESVRVELGAELAGARGTLLFVTTAGVVATYLLAEDGLVLAATDEDAALGEIVVVYDAYQSHGGALLPTSGVAYASGLPVARLETFVIEWRALTEADYGVR
jgi:hypothetical protein